MTDFDQVGFEREVEAWLNTITPTESDVKELAEIIVKDIKEGIDTGVDLRGNSFIPNTPKWIKRKQNSTVYLGKTKSLYNSIKVLSVTKVGNKIQAIITARGGGLHWQTDPKQPRYKRDFFGLSDRMINKLNSWLNGRHKT